MNETLYKLVMGSTGNYKNEALKPIEIQDKTSHNIIVLTGFLENLVMNFE